MAKKITADTAPAAPMAAEAMPAPAAESPSGDDNAAGSPENEVIPDSDQDVDNPQSSVSMPDYADHLLGVFDQYPKLYIDRQGSTYTEDTPAFIRADSALFENPHYKA